MTDAKKTIIESAIKVLLRTPSSNPYYAKCIATAVHMETQMLVGNPEYDKANLELASWILEADGVAVDTVTNLTHLVYMEAQEPMDDIDALREVAAANEAEAQAAEAAMYDGWKDDDGTEPSPYILGGEVYYPHMNKSSLADDEIPF